jgi:putative ABC transport system ATP-binding protein
VAEEGPYWELSKNKDGAFSKLMEWQLSGDGNVPRPKDPKPSEEEEIQEDLGKDAEDKAPEEATVDTERSVR